MKRFWTAPLLVLGLVLAGCPASQPPTPPTTTGGTTTGGTTGLPTTTGGTTGFPTTTGGFPTTTGGFPTTTGGATTGGTTGTTTGTTTGGTTGGTTTGGATGTIEGTVTLPSGASVAGAAAVFACYLTGDQAAPCDQALSGVTEIQLAGVSSASYSISNLQSGQYAVIALADADGNGSVEDATDYVGFYSTDGVNPTPVTPPQTGIDITLQPAGGGGDTPGGTDLTGTWTGTTTTPEPPQGLGTEPTTFELTQTGGGVSGTLTTSDDETTVTGTVSGSSATISGVYNFPEVDLTYTYEGTFSDTTYSGTITVSDETNQVQGEFSVTRSSGLTAPLDKLQLNRLFRSIQ